MRPTTLLSALAAAAAVAADTRTAKVYVQPVAATPSSPHPPALLAEIAYDPLALSPAAMLSYEAPDLPEDAALVRIGLYDDEAGRWISGTTAASVDNFAKGYSPNIMLTVDATPAAPAAADADDADAATPLMVGTGDVVSVACKGVAIDAGQTRDFGPQVVVLPEARGAQPVLNEPVVLSREGGRVQPEQDKTFFQK